MIIQLEKNYYLRLLFRIMLFLVLAMLWWWEPFEHLPSDWSSFLPKFVEFLLFVVGLNLALTMVLFVYRKRKGLSLTEQNNLTSGAENIYGLIITFSLIGFILGLWGIELKTLFTSLSIVAAAIAIVSKEFVSAIIGGFIIAVTRDLSIGDFVRIGDYRGKIIDISLTKIALLNEDDDLIYIANDKAYLAEIINYSRGDIRRVSIAFELSTSFVGTVEALESNLIRELDQYKEHIAPDSFNLRIVDISKDAISFKFQYTLAEVNRDLEKEIKKKTVRRVLNYVKQQSHAASS